MNVLVTGATGFVGRALIPRLQADGHVVRAAVRTPAGLANESVVGEMAADTDWSAALQGCDAVVHLASRVHVMQDWATDPLVEYRRVNTAGTLNLTRQAVTAGIQRLVFASSIKVNGEGRIAPYAEFDPPAPEDAYALSKWEAEQGLTAIAAGGGLEIVVLRIPLVYGPGVGANFLRLMQAVDRGMPLPFGCIENRRSLVYLVNLVDAIVTCVTHPGAANRTFLISDGVDVSTPELIRQLAAALHRPARLLPVPPAWLRLAGMLSGKKKATDRLLGSLSVDSTAIRSALGWTPPYTLREGLAVTAGWYLEQQNRKA